MTNPIPEPKEVEKGIGIPTYTEPPRKEAAEQDAEECSDE